MSKGNNKDFLSSVVSATDMLKTGSLSLEEWGRLVCGEDLYGEVNLRRCATFFQKFLTQLEADQLGKMTDDEKLQQIESRLRDLQLERKKLQRENTELQEKYRRMGQSDLLNERLVDAILNLPEIVKVPSTSYLGKHPSHRTGLLCLSDFHAGSEFEVKGFGNKIVNKYNMDVLKDRMGQIICAMREPPYKMDKLVVALLGDFFENILRMSSLTKLQAPVVDTVIDFSEFLSHWLVKLQQVVGVPVVVSIVGGNHDVNRPLGSKSEFEDENLGKLVCEFISLRLLNCDDITIRPYSDFDAISLEGTVVGFTHGRDSNLQTTLEYYSNLNSIRIDHVYAGHLHSPASKSVGLNPMGGDKEVIRVGSICGTDTYAKKLCKSASPSGYFCYYDSKGRGWSKTIYLK